MAKRDDFKEDDELSKIKLIMAKNGIRRKELISETKLSLSTINKFFIGEYTEYTMVKIQDSLEKLTTKTQNKFEKINTIELVHSSPDLGFYSRKIALSYEGDYLTVRPSFSNEGAIYVYITKIIWSDEGNCLIFEEYNRVDAVHSHVGVVSIPLNSNFAYLISGEDGWKRICLLYSIDRHDTMRGVLVTLHNVNASINIPVCAPILYKKKSQISGGDVGVFERGDRKYESYKNELDINIGENLIRMYGKME